jgi:ABC-type dipeptide/oligopeptide/nickel transport system ATPase component
LFITHDLTIAAEICDRIAVMYAGEIVELGPTEEVMRRPRHPYAAALLATSASLERRDAFL